MTKGTDEGHSRLRPEANRHAEGTELTKKIHIRVRGLNLSIVKFDPRIHINVRPLRHQCNLF